MQKIRKILKSRFWENYVTNQPTITNNTDFIGPGWRRSNKFTFGLQKLCLQVTTKTNTHNA